MNDAYATRVHKALTQEMKRLNDALEHGFDTDVESAAATDRLNTLEGYEQEVRWNHEEEVGDLGAFLNVS